MSTIVQVIIGLLLLLAGLISVIAAVLGDPIRLWGKALPGPNGTPARAVAASIGTAALAACALVFILGGGGGTPAAGSGFNPPAPTTNPAQALTETGATSGSVGGLPALTATPTPTGSPKPPAAPSTAPPVPGKPTVTSVKVSAGSVSSSCDQTYHAAVTVANGPVTIKYVISVRGFVVGANPRTATVTGTSANLDDYTVDVLSAGEIVYNILSPNLLSDQKTWNIPSACQPALNIGTPYILDGPGSQDLCAGALLVFRSKLTVSAPPGGTNVTYHVEVNDVARPDHTELFLKGDTLVGESVTLPNDPDSFSVKIRYVITKPVQDSATAVLSGPCYSPPPPPPPPPPTTDDPTTDAPPPDPDPTTEDPGVEQTALAHESPVELTSLPSQT